MTMKSGKFTIQWGYTRIFRKPFAGEPIKLSQEAVLERTNTVCTLEEGTKMIHYGIAFCVPIDNFNRDKGRKLSLTRALHNSPLTKEERKEVWEVYRAMTVKPRW